MLVEHPILLIAGVVDGDGIQLPGLGEVVQVVGIRLRAARVAQVNGGRAGKLRIRQALAGRVEQVVRRQPLRQVRVRLGAIGFPQGGVADGDGRPMLAVLQRAKDRIAV